MNFIKALKDTGSDKKATLRPMLTPWGENISSIPLPEYPRPQLVRDSWCNLNGTWNCTFTQTADIPSTFETPILVPFSPESLLSGVNRQLTPQEYLWYQRTLSMENLPEGKRCLLHFGAVDQSAVVFVNGNEAGRHEGGYLPFVVDITEHLRPGDNSLLVRVQDVSDTSYHSRGKQKLQRGGMFYTAQSGIWQTVWLEWVPQYAVENVLFEAASGLDGVILRMTTNAPAQTPVKGCVYENGTPIARISGQAGEEIEIPLPQAHLWTPEDPFLYDVELTLGDGEHGDHIRSYFAVRSFSVEKDETGTLRFCLNHKPYFLHGVLDQGYWSDGLYTAPADEALLFDIRKMKEHGFNMLRKHIKIECERWYYHCDRLGMIVWQDMVCGGGKYNSAFVTMLPTVFPGITRHIADTHYRLFARSSKTGREEFEKECEETIRLLKNHPCIAVWVPFNEGWGQFDSVRISQLIRTLDPTRPIDAASGWFDRGAGDFISSHIYFRKLRTPKHRKNDDRAFVISEYGGYAHPVTGHTSMEHVYGYSIYKDAALLNNACRSLMQNQLQPLIRQGLCGAVYTQVSDVEEEVNGILTYDRRVDKFEASTFTIDR